MTEDADLTPFENWLANLEVDVIEGEYGYERGEFTIYSSHWLELFDQGLTPREAWIKALDGYANARRDAEGRICPISGLPCKDGDKAIRHVFAAYNYGIENGFIPDSDAKTIQTLRHERLDCQVVMDGQQAEIEHVRAELDYAYRCISSG